MKVIWNNMIPTKGYCAMMILGVVFARKDWKPPTMIYDMVMAHEEVHKDQMLELAVVPFYLLYGLEYLVKLACYRKHKKAYRSISFEREARVYATGSRYGAKRKRYGWIKYLWT